MRVPKGKITERELHRSLLESITSKTNDNIYAYYGSAVLDKPSNSVEIPISSFNSFTDILLIHKNGTLIKEDYDYTFDANGKSIIKADGTKWNNFAGQRVKFEFMSIKNIKRYTRLSNIELRNGTLPTEKLDSELTRGLIPKGGHTGSYLIKRSPMDNDYTWADFTNVTVILNNKLDVQLDEVIGKLTDIFTEKERFIKIKNNIINLTDLTPGDYELTIFNTKGFSPEFPSYPFTVTANTSIQVPVTMIERSHDIQLEVRSDIDIVNPSVIITNIFTNEQLEFKLEGSSTSIARIISLPSGSYKAEIKDDGTGLKQVTESTFKLDYTHSTTSVIVTVLNQYRVCNIDTNFRPVIYSDNNLDKFIPLYEQDVVNVLNPFDLTEVNNKDMFEIKVDILNLKTGRTSYSYFKAPKAGLQRYNQLYLANGVPYRIRISVTDGKFNVIGSVFEIKEGVDTINHSCEIYENVSLLKFVPSVVDKDMFKGTKNIGRRYYNIEIYQSDSGTFASYKIYKKILNVKPDAVIKVAAGKYYRFKITPDNGLDTRVSNTTFGSAVKLKIGESVFDPSHITDMITTYTPIITYGFRIDPSNSDPGGSVTYLEDAKDFIPIKHVNGKIDLGSWDRTFITNSATPVILNNGKVETVLSKDNQSAAYNRLNINEDFKGDFMVKFEKCYYTFREELNGCIEFRISTIKVGPEYNAFAFTNFEGVEKDAMYYGMYEASYDGNGFRSLPRKSVQAKHSMGEMYANISAKGMGYTLEDYSKRMYIMCIHTLLSKSLDSQFCFGYGNTDNVDLINTGSTENETMFYGDNKSVKSFYIENLWGNAETWLQGLMYHDGSFRYRHNGPYTSNHEDYLIADVTVNPSDEQNPSNNIITKCTAGTFGFLPQLTSGNVNYYNDIGYISTNFPIPTVGGSYKDKNGAGLWNMKVFYTWSDSNDTTSGRLVFV